MQKHFAYTRVSTPKQGEGVSLQEQKAAIERYANRHTLEISEWFEERESAAKRGRPVFSKMIRRLRAGEAAGLVIHKIDRSARNLRDWAELGELIDAGAAVHFANESLDLLSRSGRLSADIQAVVAADYIRNLREETRKGFYGRLKQGLYPLPAPLGYLDQGAGKPKKIDAVRGPLVRQAFELYDTGQYSLDEIAAELRTLGLTRRGGSALYKSALSVILNNPFYTGVIHIRSTGERFPGGHQPLVKRSLFDRVQARLSGKTRATAWKHQFPFRRLFRCRECGFSMTGERQKGHIYYRCHQRECPTKGVREEVVDQVLQTAFRRINLPSDVLESLRQRVQEIAGSSSDHQEDVVRSLGVQLANAESRLVRLTDALVDGLIDKAQFNERRGQALDERDRLLEARDSAVGNPNRSEQRIAEIFELAKSPSLSYEHASSALRRELIEKITSNRLIGPNNVAVELREPFSMIAEANGSSNGAPLRNNFRTHNELATRLWQWVAGRTLAERFGKVTT